MTSAYPDIYEEKPVTWAFLWAGFQAIPSLAIWKLALDAWISVDFTPTLALFASTAIYGLLWTYWLWSVCEGLPVAQNLRVIPYFERTVSEGSNDAKDTYNSGNALARDWKRLERMSEDGANPLFLLKFSPLPIRQKSIVWHSAQSGVACFSSLLAEIEGHEKILKNAAAVKKELELILRALELAATNNVKFALVLKCGFSSSQLEWDEGGGVPHSVNWTGKCCRFKEAGDLGAYRSSLM